MCNSEQRQSISEQGNLLNSYGLIRTPSKNENSYVEAHISLRTLKSDNDKKEEPLCRCDHCLKNRSNRKRFLKSDLIKRNKTFGSIKHSNDLDSSKYWLSGEEFFRTPLKKFNEPDESTKSNIFQYRLCLDSNHTKLDDTFLLPTREKSADIESYMLKDVNKNPNGNDSDFLDHFELPFYWPESNSTDHNTKNKTKVSLQDSTREKKEEEVKDDDDSNEILNWINDFERTRKRRYSNDLDRKTKENTWKNSSSSNCPFVTKNFDETIRTSPNKDVRKSNKTEDSRCCISESLKERKDVLKNIKKTDSQNQSNRWIIENISDIVTSKETSSKLTNSIRVIPNTANIYNNIYLSSKHSEKFFNISKLIKLMRRCARVSRIRRRIFKGTNNRSKNRLSIIYKKDRSLFVNDSNDLKENVCDTLAGIKEELSDNLRAVKKLYEKLPNSNIIRSVSMPEVEDTLNEVITRCKNYIRDNNYCEKAVTKMNDLLTKSVNDLQKVMKVEKLVHSKKTLRKPIEEQNYKHLESIQGGQDFLKDDIKQALNGKKKMIDRKNKIKGLINDMLRLTNDIITVEDNKENIKKPVNRKTSISNNLQNKQSNNRLDIKMNRDKNVKSSTVKKVNQMESEMNFVSQPFQAGSSNVRKNKLVNFKKDKALKENQNRSEKPIVYQQQLQNLERKKSTRTISNISFGNNKEKVKNNPGSCLLTTRAIKDKKNNDMCERKTRISSSIYITDKHRDRSRKSDDIRLKRQIQPVWKPGGAVKSFASNPMFLNSESTNRRTWQNCLEKDNQEIKKSIVNPSEPTITDRNNFFKEYRRNENFSEKRVTDLCELLAETKTMQKELKDNSNLLSETRSSPYNRSQIPLSNKSLTKIRVNSTDLNPKKDKSEFKSRPGIPKLNPLKVLFNDKRDNKLPVAHNCSKNIPTEDYEKKEEDKEIFCSNERNDKRNSSMVLLEVPDKFPAIPSSVYKNQETNEETTSNNIKEKSFTEKLNSSNEVITKVDDSLQKSILKSNINFDRDAVIENQPSLISFRNMNCNVEANSMSNSITMVTSPKYCQLSCLSSLSSKTDFIFEQSIERNKSNKIDKDSLENSTDDNDEENEFKLDELKDGIKEDSDLIEEKKKYPMSLNISDILCSSIPYVLTNNFEDQTTKLQYSNIKKDISRDSLNKVSINSKSGSDTDQEMKSMRVIERARFNDNKSIDRTIDEKKCKSSQTLSDSKSFSDAYTNVEDINSNRIKYVDRIVPSPNDIDWKISLKDVATEILSQDQSILLPTQMIQTQTNERSSTKKNVATDSFINSSNNCNETKIVVNVDSKSISVCEEKVLDHNDRWVMDTVELYCEQPNDDLPISTENHKEENDDCNDPNDRWVAETVDLYCEQPNYESDSKEDKNELNKSSDSKINNNFNIEKSMLSVSLIDQLKGIREQLQSVDVKLNKLQETTKEANDAFSRINVTTTPFDSNIKERMSVSSYDLSESSNIKNVMIDERRSSSTIESSSSNSFKRSSRILKERRFERFNVNPNEMSDAFQMTSCYSKNLCDAIKIDKDGSIVNNQSDECKKSSSTSFEKSVGHFEKGSTKFDEQLTCEYFNKNCFHSCDNNNFNDDDEEMISIKSKSSSVEHIFYELRATDHSSSSDNESDKTGSYVFLSTKNSNDMKERETISDSIKKVSSNVLSIKDKRLEIMKYSDKETYFTFYNENIVSNDYNDLTISREGLLLLIYFTVCFFVFVCLNFSIACEPWFIS
ncbi:MATH and LRR domain-containing protein PFE0570w-like [Vespula squamosa]|uniref:MATH and LRR domain-containing protein PFE0570w-like n=1 Tax=Vespula squamosa TaxID=30214 RepID=A0ABD1ZTQ9_VESSQ